MGSIELILDKLIVGPGYTGNRGAVADEHTVSLKGIVLAYINGLPRVPLDLGVSDVMAGRINTLTGRQQCFRSNRKCVK